MNRTTQAYVLSVTTAGCGAALLAAFNWQAADPAPFGLLTVLAIFASTLKVRLPGIGSNLSPGFIMVLASVTFLPWTAAAVVCPLAAATQCVWNAKRRPKVIQVLFNAASLTVAGVLAALAAGSEALASSSSPVLAQLCTALVVLYFTNVMVVSTVVCLSQSSPITSVLRLCNYYSFPAYLVGTLVCWVMIDMGKSVPSAMLIPAALIVPSYLFYRTWVERSADRQTA